AGWPERPVRVVLSSPAGGALDALQRVLGERLASRLRQAFVPDFRPGASGTIAAEIVARSAPDGYTLLLAPAGVLTDAPHTMAMRFDPLEDLQPLAELARSSLVLVGHPGLPPRDLGELIAYVKARPGKVAYASFSPGTRAHFAGVILGRRAGLDMPHVGYKGSPPALLDVLGGQVPLMFDSLITSTPHVKAGRLRAYAVAAEARSEFVPEVPT